MARETLNTAIVDQSPDRVARSGGFGEHQRVPSAPPIRRDHELPAVTGELMEGWETPYVPEFSAPDGAGSRRGSSHRGRSSKLRRGRRSRRDSQPVTTKTSGGTVVTFPPQNAPGTTVPGEPGDIGRITATISAIPDVPETAIAETAVPDVAVSEAAVPDTANAFESSTPPLELGSTPLELPDLDLSAPSDLDLSAPSDLDLSAPSEHGSLAAPQPILFTSDSEAVPLQEDATEDSADAEDSADPSEAETDLRFAISTSDLAAGDLGIEESNPEPQDADVAPEDPAPLQEQPAPSPPDPAEPAQEVIGEPEPATKAWATAGPASKADEFEDDESLEALLADLSAATSRPPTTPQFQLASRPEQAAPADPDEPESFTPESSNPASSNPVSSNPASNNPVSSVPEPAASEPIAKFEWDLTPPPAPIEERPPSLKEMLAPPIDDIRFAPPSASAPLVNPPDLVDPPLVAEPVSQVAPFDVTDPTATIEVSPRVEPAVEPALVQPEADLHARFVAPSSEPYADLDAPIFDPRDRPQPRTYGSDRRGPGTTGKSAAESFASETSLLPAKTRRGDVRVVDPADGGSWFTRSAELPVIQVADGKQKRKRRRLRRFLRRLLTSLLLCVVLGALLFAALSTIYI